MTEDELKKIHGEDVELAEDDSEDEQLTEEQALARAKEEGIEFVDEWLVYDKDEVLVGMYADQKEAQKQLKIGQSLVQRRRQKDEGDE